MTRSVLIVTNRHDSHADYVIERLSTRGISFVRLNTDDFPSKTNVSLAWSCNPTRGSINFYGQRTDILEIKSVWFRRPLGFGINHEVTDSEARRFAEDECTAALEGLYWSIPVERWISHPHAIRRGQNKILQLHLAQTLGFGVPRTLITTDPEEFKVFWEECRGEVIWKALGRNTTTGDTQQLQFAYTNKLDAAFLDRLQDITVAPCLFQEYVSKLVELRITVVDHTIFACEIHSQASEKTRIDWRRYDTGRTPHAPCTLPREVETLCLQLVQELGLRFGAIDMIVTPAREYKFVEINPNGQWLWIEQITGMRIADALIETLAADTALL